jgi:hypothetical protein
MFKVGIQHSIIFKKPVSGSSKAPKKNHQKQTTKNNHTQKQVCINKTKTVHHTPTQEKVPKLDNSVMNLIKKTCVKLMCKEILKINDVTTKISRPFIKLETIKGVKTDCLFDTGAGLTCMTTSAFRRIAKECRPKKICTIGSKAQGASGNSLLPEGVYMIPMEWNGKKIMQKVPNLQKSGTTNNPGN